MTSFEYRFNLLPGLLLGMILLLPLRLLGAEQTVPQPEQTVPQPEQTVPQPEQTVPQPEQTVPQPEQTVPQPEQSVPQPEQSVPQPEQSVPQPEQAVTQPEQSVQKVEQPVPPTPKSDSFDSMDASRDYLSGKITSFASDIDRFFGGDRHYQESNSSVFHLSLARGDGYGGERKFEPAVRLNLRLPVTEGQLRLLVETDPEKNITEGATPAQGNAALQNKVVVPKSVAVAVRLAAVEKNVWHFNTDVGLKFPIPPKLFARARGSYSVPLGMWRLKAAESVYWFNTTGVGETTQLDLERIIRPQLLFRASSNATWLRDKQNFDLRQDLSFYHTINDRSALMYQASVIGVSNPQLQVMDYVVLLFYRYRMHKEWLFFEISPQLHFPREENYRRSPALSMRMEILFDDSR